VYPVNLREQLVTYSDIVAYMRGDGDGEKLIRRLAGDIALADALKMGFRVNKKLSRVSTCYYFMFAAEDT
jgi:hypothetical protein